MSLKTLNAILKTLSVVVPVALVVLFAKAITIIADSAVETDSSLFRFTLGSGLVSFGVILVFGSPKSRQTADLPTIISTNAVIGLAIGFVQLGYSAYAYSSGDVLDETMGMSGFVAVIVGVIAGSLANWAMRYHIVPRQAQPVAIAADSALPPIP